MALGNLVANPMWAALSASYGRRPLMLAAWGDTSPLGALQIHASSDQCCPHLRFWVLEALEPPEPDWGLSVPTRPPPGSPRRASSSGCAYWRPASHTARVKPRAALTARSHCRVPLRLPPPCSHCRSRTAGFLKHTTSWRRPRSRARLSMGSRQCSRRSACRWAWRPCRRWAWGGHRRGVCNGPLLRLHV